VNKEQFIALGLTEEVAEKAAAASGDELKGFIPKARFDELNTSKKQAEDTLKERDNQLEELKKTAGDSAALQEQITKLQADNKAASDKYEADMKELQLSTVLKMALTGKVHDPDIVAGLLDKTKIELDDAGGVKAGLDDQIKAMQTSKAFLFVPEEKGGLFKFKGTNTGEPGGGGAGSGNDDAEAFGKRVADFSKANADTSAAQKSYFGG